MEERKQSHAMREDIQLQRDYYTKTAGKYQALHMQQDGAHDFALQVLQGLIAHHGFSSVLDVGSGTGRAVANLQAARPGLKILGLEPVAALREIGYRNGLARDQLIEGDGTKIALADGAFDVVCSFGVLHHVPNPEQVIREMLRVAKKAVFISDCNRFGSGSYLGRRLKLGLYRIGLWPLANFIKTKGKGYTLSEGDGVAYSYSIFDNFATIAKACARVQVMNYDGREKNPVLGSLNIVVIGLKGQ